MKKNFTTSFLGSILILASGSVIAQGITALSSPVLTRIYLPNDIGIYTYLLSIAAIFMAVVNARYDVSIVTDSEERNVFPLIKLALLIGIIISIVAFLGCLAFFLYKRMSWYLAIYIFIVILSYAIINVLTAYNNRRKEYKIISSVYVIRTASQNLGAIGLGLACKSIHGLLFPYILGQYLGIKRQMQPLLKHWRKIAQTPISSLKEVAIKHKKQLYFSTPALLANSLSYSIITIFIEILYGLSEVAFYSISVRVLGLPLAIIGGNVSKVFIERASLEYKQHKQFTHAFRNTFYFLFVLAIPMVIVLVLWATPMCRFVFGTEWAVAGDYIMILAPMFGIRFITSALSPAFIIINKQGAELLLQIVFLASGVVSFAIAQIYNLEINDFLKLISGLFSMAYIIYLFAIYQYSKI